MTTKYQAGTRVSEYVLEACVGAGAFGEVWRARHHVWADQFVAVKLPIEPEYVRFLQREGIVVHGVRHPNIVRVLGLDSYAENPYLIMELVNGPALKQVIADHPKGVPIEAALLIMRSILSAMQAAHTAGILHRDLKPGNVLLNLAGRALGEVSADDVKVSDFGLGVDSGDTLRSIAQSVSMERDSNQLVGTLAYMAPEVREGQRPHDARSDLYSIGVMFFELLTGERPAGTEYPSTLRSEVPTKLDDVFRRLYARYERRYESAAAVLADLAADNGPASATSHRAADSDATYRVVLQAAGPSPIAVIAVVRMTTNLGLAEAKKLVDRVPATIVERMNERDAYRLAGDLEQAAARASVFAEGRHATTPRRTPPPLPGKGAGHTPAGRCTVCQQPVSADDQFCMSCGKQVAGRVRRCPSCQGWPGPNDRFCIFCGTSLAPGEGA